MEEWKSGRMENCKRMEKWENCKRMEKWENCKRMEKWEDGKYLVFPRVCLVGGMKKWEDGKLFCLVEKKSGRIEKVIYIN